MVPSPVSARILDESRASRAPPRRGRPRIHATRARKNRAHRTVDAQPELSAIAIARAAIASASSGRPSQPAVDTSRAKSRRRPGRLADPIGPAASAGHARASPSAGPTLNSRSSFTRPPRSGRPRRRSAAKWLARASMAPIDVGQLVVLAHALDEGLRHGEVRRGREVLPADRLGGLDRLAERAPGRRVVRPQLGDPADEQEIARRRHPGPGRRRARPLARSTVARNCSARPMSSRPSARSAASRARSNATPGAGRALPGRVDPQLHRRGPAPARRDTSGCRRARRGDRRRPPRPRAGARTASCSRARSAFGSAPYATSRISRWRKRKAPGPDRRFAATMPRRVEPLQTFPPPPPWSTRASRPALPRTARRRRSPRRPAPSPRARARRAVAAISAWIDSGTRTSKLCSSAATHRSSRRTRRPSSISIRTNSSQNSGLPSARATIAARSSSGMPSMSSSRAISVRVSSSFSGSSTITVEFARARSPARLPLEQLGSRDAHDRQ